jgi:hypothetical protein
MIRQMNLLSMINGKVAPMKAFVRALAKELRSDPFYLCKLAAKIRP